MSDELESPLSRAISKARGDIRTDADMKAVIDFGNKMADVIKASPETRLRIYPTSCELHANGYHTACAEIDKEVERLNAEVERLTYENGLCRCAFETDELLRIPEVGNLNALQIVKKLAELADGLSTARTNAIDEATGEVRSVIKGWRSDLDESWDERPDLSFEASDKIAGANEIIAALEALKDQKI